MRKVGAAKNIAEVRGQRQTLKCLEEAVLRRSGKRRDIEACLLVRNLQSAFDDLTGYR